MEHLMSLDPRIEISSPLLDLSDYHIDLTVLEQ